MAIKLKRRNTGAALVSGTAPLSTGAGGIGSGEAVWDNVANILYIGGGDDGSGNSTSIRTVAGTGAFVPFSSVGAASGVASLNASGQIPAAQLPASITGAMAYQGVWNASTNTPALASGVGTKGYFYKVSVAGTTVIDGNAAWNVGDIITFDGTTWDKIDGPAEAVTTVAGRVGAITLTTTDIGGFAAAAASAAPVQTVAGRAGAVVLAVSDISGAAPLASPALTGTPTAPTATAGANTTQLATTAFVATSYAPLSAPALINPTVGTQTAGNNTTLAASTAFVTAALTAFSPTSIDGGVV